MDVIAEATALVGATMVALRRWGRQPAQAAFGESPQIPQARPQKVMTLKMPKATGWIGDHRPQAAQGLKVEAYARALDHPRWLEVLGNGDVLVAESRSVATAPKSFLDRATQSMMRRAGSLGISANRITRLRGIDAQGQAQVRETFLEGLHQPFGMAVVGRQFFVGNSTGVLCYDYDPQNGTVSGAPQTLLSFKDGGHWTRSLIVSPDQKRLYVGVGSLSNIGDEGMAAEEGRAAIWALPLDGGAAGIFASGLRNPVGMAFAPDTNALWTVVNERDGLGDETPPDYLTSVQEDGFYGWPYCYWGQEVDSRVAQDPALVARAIRPDYALGGHTASLGLCWMPEGTLPGFGAGMVIGQHGSWNRSLLSGYKLIFVPFAGGQPSGPARDILWGFLSEDERLAYGRPVGVCVGPDRASLLMADDVGNVIWRIAAAD